MKTTLFYMFLLCSVLFTGCNSKTKSDNALVKHDIDIASQQMERQVQIINDSGKILNPRTVYNGKIEYVPNDDWTSGFFAGSLWYMYELTGNKKWEKYGIKFTEALDSIKYLKWHHDIGFMIYCSYGNAYRITKNPTYKDVIIEAARSLSTRFRAIPGVIQSWDENRGWQSKKGWSCPVIIDNMMNLELLFEATRLSGDSTFYKIAVSHADVTLANHFRKDHSCYHVIDYDKKTGAVLHKQTAQGYSDESSWARGQAWALYGYTVCYRETRNKAYLEQADKIYNFLFENKNMPADLIPYWDFDAPNIPNEPRDASAAAVIASALYELSGYGKPEYKDTADKIIRSLSSPAYLAIVGTNGNFILMHSVGSIPHHSEIDVPLNYADYYFLEALTRKKIIDKM
ncbi:glycoside hydrolase family 88 protein [Coprobacter tertius]|uniref:Glycoside hydrolase family 88 protein n=1 Tax=Coprobacter tertius TaxID=2944915 RepID=A0ABT1MJC7_9BACT|nr:glycoside hydrolase family 88 protein [Coprobacter tertius]MCP9612526.1 glycoside hydrolase family 88 protein [Coprobacter tertius]